MKDYSYQDVEGQDFGKQDLRDCNFNHIYASGVSFSGSNLTGVDLSSSYLLGADFSGTNLSGTNLSNVYAHGADFRNCKIFRADFTGAILSNVKMSAGDLNYAIQHGAIV